MGDGEQGPDDLATLVRDRRLALGLSVEDAAKRGDDLSPTTWRRVENGYGVRNLTFTAIETALSWTTGSIRRYLATGAEPAEIEKPEQVVEYRGPALYDASWEELQAEQTRRYLDAMRAARRPVAGATLSTVSDTDAPLEDAESLRARGMLPGAPLGAVSANERADAPGDAGGGQY